MNGADAVTGPEGGCVALCVGAGALEIERSGYGATLARLAEMGAAAPVGAASSRAAPTAPRAARCGTVAPLPGALREYRRLVWVIASEQDLVGYMRQRARYLPAAILAAPTLAVERWARQLGAAGAPGLSAPAFARQVIARHGKPEAESAEGIQDLPSLPFPADVPVRRECLVSLLRKQLGLQQVPVVACFDALDERALGLLMDAFFLVRKRHRDAVLVLTGNPWPRLRARCDAGGPDCRVRAIGRAALDRAGCWELADAAVVFDQTYGADASLRWLSAAALHVPVVVGADNDTVCLPEGSYERVALTGAQAHERLAERLCWAIEHRDAAMEGAARALAYLRTEASPSLVAERLADVLGAVPSRSAEFQALFAERPLAARTMLLAGPLVDGLAALGVSASHERYLAGVADAVAGLTERREA